MKVSRDHKENKKLFQDGIATLRLFSETDEVFRRVAAGLGLRLDEARLWQTAPPCRVEVPYNRTGHKSDSLVMVLDLSPGKAIRLNPYHNCQGSSE